jgi:endonuclease YncB( thermonuclease family)
MVQPTTKNVSRDAFNTTNQSATIQIPNGEPDPDAAASLPEYEVVPGSIHDGDTLRVRSSKGEVLKVRFACVDAPDSSSRWVKNRAIICDRLSMKLVAKLSAANNNDRYGRTVAQLWKITA